ncbi:LacI family DNA-binding transcriptional regulator [Pseudonocardia kunmingensis]|uniref:LacI family transcriptional regulator n=1 Tax=Pseudonocardia kunmingensis TaxID=630975 RepID=A0A543DAW1_9PSEU|nr:LacI family DNA-binding transcriptional regulator [Pseudonocardia kunmingensis]TQM06471.1 LacI family transcriptional regulator [Pseudonocardia kunmingensis]
MSTIKDVAEAAGVSIATVSRALHGQPRVSEATRRRVLTVAADLRYVASPSAAGLATGLTHAIGVVAPFVNRWFFAAIVHSAEERLRRAGYDLLLYSLGTEAEERRRAFSGALLRKRVDGVLVLGLHPAEDEVAALSAAGGPVAIVGKDVPGWASVRIDDRAAAGCAVRHLLDLGHRRIGFLGGETDDPLGSTLPGDRRAGYHAELSGAGLPADPALEAVGGFTVRGGYAAAERLLQLAHPPTAIFAASDEMAIGAVQAIRRAGLRVPLDVSVVGLDDHEMAEVMDLTTVAQPVGAQGELAAEMILTALAEPGRPLPAVTVPTGLVVRGTTSRPTRRS